MQLRLYYINRTCRWCEKYTSVTCGAGHQRCVSLETAQTSG